MLPEHFYFIVIYYLSLNYCNIVGINSFKQNTAIYDLFSYIILLIVKYTHDYIDMMFSDIITTIIIIYTFFLLKFNTRTVFTTFN